LQANYSPQGPFGPDLPETAANYEGPVGVTGIFNGNVATGCSYDPLSHSAHRTIDDIVVPGSIGKYPLKMTRYYNSRQLYYGSGLGPGWAHEYSWLLTGAGHKVVSPHGNTSDDSCGGPVGVSEGWEQRADAYNGTWRLADGGTVVFSSGGLTDIYDPYGQRTRIAYDANGQRVKVTEPGGRCLWFTYSDQDQDGSRLLTWVQAYDVDGHPGSPIAPTGHIIDWVNYTYTSVSPGVQGRDKKMLTGVTYSDGTSASYQYCNDNVHEGPTSHKMYPLLQRCDDVRYNGPMRTIWYQYQGDGPHGVIINEKYPGIGAVSATTPGVPVTGGHPGDYSMPTVFTETRGDGPTRTFTYTAFTWHVDTDPPGPCPDITSSGPPQQMLDHYTDFQGNTTTLGYDANWYINSVRDANTHTTTYTRGPAPPAGIGQITKITHPDTTHVDYTYYNEGTGHIGGHYINTVSDERGGVTTYTRDPNYRVTRIDYPSNQWTPASHEEFVYNGFGQVTRHRLKNGNYEHYQYDARGLLLYKWNPTANATAQGGDPKITYAYYGSGWWRDRVWRETLPANVSSQVATETYEYDRTTAGAACAGRGLITKITHADGKWQSSGYSQFGSKLWEENELRQRTIYTYDNYNRVLTAKDPMNHTETSSYLKPGASSSYLHTTNSVYTHTSRAGIVTTNTYDQNFRKASSAVGSATTSFDYDNVGNVTWVTDPLTHKTRNIYDNRNRKASTTEAQGTNLAATTVWHYDGAGNINQVDRPDNTHETKGYDGLNRMIWDSVPQGPTVNLTTRYGYNSSGTLFWVKNPQQAVNDATAGTYFEYDESNQRIRMWYPGLTEKQEWAYDNAHNLKSRTTVHGETQSFTYDSRNRKTGMSWSNGVDSATYGYDDAGRLTSASNANSTVTRTYYADDRLEHDYQAVAGIGTKSANYVYDGDGNVTWMNVSPFDNPSYNWTFSYDSMGRFEKIFVYGAGNPSSKYAYDSASNVTHRYTYLPNTVTVDQSTPRDSLNRMSGRWIYKSGTGLAGQGYTYDRMNRLTKVIWGSVSDMYGYYWNSELLWCEYRVHTDGPMQVQEGQDPDLDTTDNIDPLGDYQPPETAEAEPAPPPDGPPPAQPQLPDTAQFERGVGYYLDKAGNRTSVVDTVNGNTTYAPNPLNQYTGLAGGGAITNGNQHEVSNYKGITYSYINDEHLKQVSDGTNTYYLYYDALGRCVKRTLNPGNVTTYYIYDGEKPVLEYKSTDLTHPARNLYGKGIDEILMRTDPTVNSGQPLYYAQDHEGSVTHLIDGTPGNVGNVIETYQYDAFGAVTKMWDRNGTLIDHTALNNRFLFTGREYAATYQGTYIPAFGFYEYRARAYNPTLGRFMSEDPKLFDAGDYNLFRYCHNDPIDLTDPMGTDFGPFENPDQAYRFFDAKWNGTSIRQNQEYRVDTYRMRSGNYYVTDPTTGQGDRAKQPPILVKDATRTAINHSHGNWSKGYVDQQRQQHIEGPARNAREDSFDSGNPSKTDKQTAQKTTVYTSTPSRQGWRQGPGDKEPQHVSPMRDPHDKPAADYPHLSPEDVQKMDRNYRHIDYPPFQSH
jgi:RHS repeat-associated protein